MLNFYLVDRWSGIFFWNLIHYLTIILKSIISNEKIRHSRSCIEENWSILSPLCSSLGWQPVYEENRNLIHNQGESIIIMCQPPLRSWSPQHYARLSSPSLLSPSPAYQCLLGMMSRNDSFLPLVRSDTWLPG